MKRRDEITIDQVVRYLNSLLEADRDAMSQLIEYRVSCNEEMVRHPRCQVMLEEGGTTVGLLGVLSGLFPPLENGYPPLTLTVAGKCVSCGLTGEGLEKQGWESGDLECPLCGRRLEWIPLRFIREGE